MNYRKHLKDLFWAILAAVLIEILRLSLGL